MAKELPYFRFTVQDWQNGKISIESYELQGLFISVCGYYWINDCVLTLTMLRKKFSNAINLLEQLIELDIIKHEKRHDKIEIEFLNNQYDLLSEKRKRRQEAGSKGGNAKAMLKQKRSYKDKDKDKDKEKIITSTENESIFSGSVWDNEEMNAAWSKWIAYKKSEFKDVYKSKETEKTAGRKLWSLAGGVQSVAIQIINESIAQHYKGLFELKNNGKTQQTTTSRLGEGNHDGKEYKL